MKPQALKFPNLLSAIKYHEHCPLCHHDMVLNTMNISQADDYYLKNILNFELSSDYKIRINILTEKIDLIKYINDTRPKNYNSLSCNGTLYQGLSIKCSNCLNYHYTLQLSINLDVVPIILYDVSLNSEVFYIEDNNKINMIKNWYSSGKTEYGILQDDFLKEAYKYIKLPLIKLDLQHPRETLKKIKKLVIFS